MDLKELVLKIDEEIAKIDFEAEVSKFNNLANFLNKDPYYKALAAYCKIFRPEKVLEIGTCTGASAVALAKYATSVLTLDVDFTACNLSILNEANIKTSKLDSGLCCLLIDYSQFDLIFVDIDHSGLMEQMIHEKLVKEFKGIVFWDDVELNKGMRGFWDLIIQNKISTKWHSSGFGIVEY